MILLPVFDICVWRLLSRGVNMFQWNMNRIKLIIFGKAMLAGLLTWKPWCVREIVLYEFTHKWRRQKSQAKDVYIFSLKLAPKFLVKNLPLFSLSWLIYHFWAAITLHNREKSGPIIPSPCIFEWKIEKLRITTFAVHVWSNRVIDLTRTETAFQVLNLLLLSNKDIQDWWNYPRLSFPKK